MRRGTADYPHTVSTAFEDYESTRLGKFFGPAANQHPGLSGFSLLSHGREAFIVRLALADLAERSLDMQYCSWDGDTTGRIILDSAIKAADRGVRARLLVDDPFYRASDAVKAALDAHPNVEIRLFTPLTNRRWPILDFGRVNRRMHNKLTVADNAAAIVSGRNIGDIYFGVIESPELAERLTTYMATGVAPANSYHVVVDPNGKIAWETVKDGQNVRYWDEPQAGFRRRLVANLWRLLPINSQL
ncbi:phospholipase D-like domain-containing protein [Sinorhizobium sp. BG8]|uniref:phospholipase D-like domain-containing protein n=1 Tax=Sinorhizobium sp. BG8 TaxID=2613773 RepID=UPI00193D3475|nr:phospholipase D-like domain-containing protein [Sinorhizobium sp. BG8]QRM53812.1 hypothetical protein F3Y30_04005 [Sinorhizobium sp. BG8]